jgi:hypothetical protein
MSGQPDLICPYFVALPSMVAGNDLRAISTIRKLPTNLKVNVLGRLGYLGSYFRPKAGINRLFTAKPQSNGFWLKITRQN